MNAAYNQVEDQSKGRKTWENVSLAAPKSQSRRWFSAAMASVGLQNEATAFGLLDRFVDQGFNAIDTADSYSAWVPGNSGGESETIIGKWLRRRGRRDDVVIMIKVGSWAKRPSIKA